MDGVSKSKGKFHLENDNNYEQNKKDEEDLLCNKEIFHDISQDFNKEKDEENKLKIQYIQNKINRKESIRINQILNRIKSNILNISQTLVFKMIQKTDFYKNKRKNITKINNSSYNFENSSKNLLFLRKQFKDVLSEKKENEEIIRIIMSNNDYPSLIKFLNMTIEKLITLFSDDCYSSELEEEYFLYLKLSYKKLKDSLKKEGKSNLYIVAFTYFTGHIKEVYTSINEHKKNKCKNV